MQLVLGQPLQAYLRVRGGTHINGSEAQWLPQGEIPSEFRRVGVGGWRGKAAAQSVGALKSGLVGGHML